MRGRLLAWLGLVTAMIAVAYGARAAGGEPPDDTLFLWETFAGGAVQYALILAIVLAITWGRFDLLAVRRPSSLRRAAGYMALAIVVTWIVAGVVEAFSDPGDEQGLLPKEFDRSRVAAFVANAVLIALVAPAVEELTFRGLGYSLVAHFYGRASSILFVGLTFGLVHGLFVALPILAVFGAALALVRERTDSIYPPFVTHALFNAISLTLAVTT